jgi:hypothetical protein
MDHMMTKYFNDIIHMLNIKNIVALITLMSSIIQLSGIAIIVNSLDEVIETAKNSKN